MLTEPNICVVGCGYWGKNLVRNVHQLGYLYCVCETGVAQLEYVHAQYPDLKVVSSIAEVCADPNVDGVMLATPAEHHFRMGADLLRAGKHVFIEKPLALDWQDGVELVRLARQHQRILMVGHLLKYHPAFLKIQEMIAEPAF